MNVLKAFEQQKPFRTQIQEEFAGNWETELSRLTLFPNLKRKVWRRNSTSDGENENLLNRVNSLNHERQGGKNEIKLCKFYFIYLQ